MASPSQATIEEFERQYEIEYEQFREENKHDTVLNTIKKYPAKNAILMTLAYQSFHLLFQELIPQLSQLQLLLAFLVGYFLADFLTGLVHLLCDNIPLSLQTIQSGRTPWEWAAYGFHHHHIHPTDWNHNNIYFGAIVRAGFLFYVPFSLITLLVIKNPFLQMILLVCSHSGILSQFCHAASHGRYKGNKLVAFLQDHHIILNPSVHKIHHQQFNQNYAILNGWSNGVLNWIYRNLVAPYASDSVSAATQAKLYHDKVVERDDGTVFRVKSIQPHYVIFPDYRKHKGCLI